MHFPCASLPRWVKIETWTSFVVSREASEGYKTTESHKGDALRASLTLCLVYTSYLGAIVDDCFVSMLLFSQRVNHSAWENKMNACTLQTTRHQNRLKHFFLRHWVMFGASKLSEAQSKFCVANALGMGVALRNRMHCEQASLVISPSLRSSCSILFYALSIPIRLILSATYFLFCSNSFGLPGYRRETKQAEEDPNQTRRVKENWQWLCALLCCETN